MFSKISPPSCQSAPSRLASMLKLHIITTEVLVGHKPLKLRVGNTLPAMMEPCIRTSMIMTRQLLYCRPEKVMSRVRRITLVLILYSLAPDWASRTLSVLLSSTITAASASAWASGALKASSGPVLNDSSPEKCLKRMMSQKTF